MSLNWTLKIFTVVLLSLTILTFSQPARSAAGRTFTPRELAQYNGQNGQPAHVGLNDQVYDLTGVPQWAGGRHFCPGTLAGKDITPIWKNLPGSHTQTGFLQRYPIVGTLIPAQTNHPLNRPPPRLAPRRRSSRTPALDLITTEEEIGTNQDKKMNRRMDEPENRRKGDREQK
jgi:predicted heme/steroid binding protein